MPDFQRLTKLSVKHALAKTSGQRLQLLFGVIGAAVLNITLAGVALGQAAKSSHIEAEGPRDQEEDIALARTLLQQLQTGEFDALESEYQDFRDQEHQIEPDGTPKSWVYFWAFESSTTISSLEDSGGLVDKIKQWLAAKPYSVPAMLAFENALLGECEYIRHEATAKHLGMNDPGVLQQLKERADQITGLMQSIPGDKLPELYAEPQTCATLVHLYTINTAGYDRFKTVEDNLTALDRYYCPYYCQALPWLFRRRQEDASIPRPEVWLTDRFKLNGLDSVEDAKKKSETYAEVVAFTNPAKVKLAPGLMDWGTLKTGLKNLIVDYPGTDWSSLYLLESFIERDKQACQEALGIVAGKPSPEVISPANYEQIINWATQK
jgi:hypothetical protein